MALHVRPEQPGDADAIAAVTTAAFAGAPHSSGTEAAIIAALRDAGQLMVSRVAVDAASGRVIGHVAVSPVTISDGSIGWHGLGPIAVLPAWQGQGIGTRLVHAALEALLEAGSQGCVLLGEPGYYTRFGFAARAGLLLPGVPAAYFMALPFGDALPQGTVQYPAAFDAA